MKRIFRVLISGKGISPPNFSQVFHAAKLDKTQHPIKFLNFIQKKSLATGLDSDIRMIHRPPSVRHQARHFLYLGGRETGKPLDYDKLSSTKKSSTVRGHGIEEVLIASGLMIADFIDRNLREKPGAAVNLGIFDSVELHGLKRALGFRYEENVPDVVLLHGDGPVGGIIADGGRNLERPRDLA